LHGGHYVILQYSNQLLTLTLHKTSIAIILYYIFFIPEIRRTFNLLDKNSDERLSRSEIIKGIHLLKVHPTEEEAENIMEELDLDGMDKLQFCKKTGPYTAICPELT
jgi:ABC-type bacteriocin/lantibiotic exporter with double-glycine peptidase domain